MRRRDFEKKNHTDYKQLRNKGKLMIQKSKTTFYKETIDTCKNDPRALVKCFNELGVKNVNYERISKIKHNEVITKNIADIVSLFNYNFVNIGDKYSTMLSQTNHRFCPIKLERNLKRKFLQITVLKFLQLVTSLSIITLMIWKETNRQVMMI